jgi:hypothetical protein
MYVLCYYQNKRRHRIEAGFIYHYRYFYQAIVISLTALFFILSFILLYNIHIQTVYDIKDSRQY